MKEVVVLKLTYKDPDFGKYTKTEVHANAGSAYESAKREIAKYKDSIDIKFVKYDMLTYQVMNLEEGLK